jgi:hypothetical protein
MINQYIEAGIISGKITRLCVLPPVDGRDIDLFLELYNKINCRGKLLSYTIIVNLGIVKFSIMDNVPKQRLPFVIDIIKSSPLKFSEQS